MNDFYKKIIYDLNRYIQYNDIKQKLYKIKGYFLKRNKNKNFIYREIKNTNKNFKNILIAIFIMSTVLIPYSIIIIRSISFFTSYPPFIRFSDYAYKRVKYNPIFRKCFKNSLIISTGTTLTSLATGVLASYALSRIRFKWKKFYELFLYALQMFPGVAFIVPFFVFFILIKRYLFIPMQNTYHGLIITYASFAIPFSILMMKNFIDTIPKELDEQAQIDGCNRFNLIIKIILPLCLPGILAVAIYTFILSWNELLFAFTLTRNETMTASIYIVRNIRNKDSHFNINEWYASCVMVTLPIVIVFTLLQKKLIAGLKSSYIKD